MKSLSQHIAYLLLSCREVYVPNLGSFSAHYERAYFDPYQNLFLPSRIRINFNSENLSGFSLVESLQRKLKISHKEAEEAVNIFVIKLKTQLKRHHYCRLEGIGYLIDNNGLLSFKDTFWKRLRYSALQSVC